ncbi:MAG: PAS domain-containing protein [Proteobacteria bacterium]|nr:PAS domain-containing protein [Pseudomonadota bacterium]
MIDNAQFHPKVRQLHDYWLSIHPAGGLPGRQHFDPHQVPRLLSGLRLVEVQPVPFRLRYRLIGSKIDHVIGRNFTGRWVDEVHAGDPNYPALLEDYRSTVAQRQPSWRRGPPRVRHHDKCSILEVIRLPLASDGQTVNMVLSLTLFFDHKGQEI